MDQTFLLTVTPPLPAFCGVNDGFPCDVCTNGFEVSLLRSGVAELLAARSRSKFLLFFKFF